MDTESIRRQVNAFYDRCAALHASLCRQITGIEREQDRGWYASVLMTRLMFLAFRQRLPRAITSSVYRTVLRPLFQEEPFGGHALKRAYPSIDLPDEAVAQVLACLDGYDWVLEHAVLALTPPATNGLLDAILPSPQR